MAFQNNDNLQKIVRELALDFLVILDQENS